MTEIMRKLEPRFENTKSILFNELDEFTEILFFTTGQIEIGFELNRKKHYVFRRKNDIILADHGCTFNMKSQFIYRTFSDCAGFSIRK